MSTDRVAANLPAKSFDETADFYARLGFKATFRDDGWMILERGDLWIEFFPYPDLDPYASSFGACVRVGDVDALWRAWSALRLPTFGIPRIQGPPRDEDWGGRIFFVIDPNGSLLRCIGPPPA
jgi:catechol 2,3-dioxygenase-like lactoylglutathione lyase family enzyme